MKGALLLSPILILLLSIPVFAQSTISEETPPTSCRNKLVTGLTCTGDHQIAGDYAARADSSSRRSGYQWRKVEPSSWLSVLMRVCRSRCAPRLVHCMDCFLTNRLLSTELTVDSTNAVEIVSPRRYRWP
jgi:hypothetical protein